MRELLFFARSIFLGRNNAEIAMEDLQKRIAYIKDLIRARSQSNKGDSDFQIQGRVSKKEYSSPQPIYRYSFHSNFLTSRTLLHWRRG
jgi:hypothetical protein